MTWKLENMIEDGLNGYEMTRWGRKQGCVAYILLGGKSYSEIPSIFSWTDEWVKIIGTYNQKVDDMISALSPTLTSPSRGEKSRALPYKLTLDRPLHSKKPAVKRPTKGRRQKNLCSTPKKVKKYMYYFVTYLLFMYYIFVENYENILSTEKCASVSQWCIIDVWNVVHV